MCVSTQLCLSIVLLSFIVRSLALVSSTTGECDLCTGECDLCIGDTSVIVAGKLEFYIWADDVDDHHLRVSHVHCRDSSSFGDSLVRRGERRCAVETFFIGCRRSTARGAGVLTSFSS